MKEHPILFSAPMVRAILEGRKTQTRRIVKPAPQMVMGNHAVPWEGNPADLMQMLAQSRRFCPYGQRGDRLWVRETWYCDDYRVQSGPYLYVDGALDESVMFYRSNGEPDFEGERFAWKPAIHMPRWASRILLEVTGARVERLQDISEADAMEEGCCSSGWTPSYSDPDNASFAAEISAVENYAALWEKINGTGSWDENPWVWVIEFKRAEARLTEAA